MKFGISTLLWTTTFTARDIDILYKISDMGADAVELVDPSMTDIKEIKKALDSTGLECSISGPFGPTRSLRSDNPSAREDAKKYITDCINACSEMGGKAVGGALYRGEMQLIPEEQKTKEWNHCVEGLQELSGLAQKRGVALAVEALNRFETCFINLTQDVVRLVEEVDSPSVGVLLDTFHMNIEETRSLAEVIRDTDKHIYHFHACENDRGVTGSGHIPWQEIASALKDVDYNRTAIIESIVPQVTGIAESTGGWRKLAVDQETLAKEGLKFVKKMFV